MAGTDCNPERARIIRELLAEAESQTPRTVGDALAKRGIVTYLRAKLNEAERVRLSGD